MAGPTDPFSNLAAARKVPQPAQSFKIPQPIIDAQAKNYQTVAKNSVDGLKMLGDLTADKGSGCDDLASIYGSQKSILNNQVEMAKMGMGADMKLGLLDGALKAEKVEEKFKDAGAAIHKRCPAFKPD